MKYWYCWENDRNDIIELDGEYDNAEEAAISAAKDDYDCCSGFERDGDYPSLFIVDEFDNETAFNISIDYEPIFCATKKSH